VRHSSKRIPAVRRARRVATAAGRRAEADPSPGPGLRAAADLEKITRRSRQQLGFPARIWCIFAGRTHCDGNVATESLKG
jgi:hypothetical protein